MADQKSIAKNLSELKRFNSTLSPKLSVKLWFDEKEEEKGIPIPIMSIMTFNLRESMFLKLPVGNLTYADDGTFKNSNLFRPGRIIYIGFEYKPMATESDKSNISVGRYRIENVKIMDNGNQSILYSVSFIYDAIGYINSIPSLRGESCLSTDIMQEACSTVGIAFSSGVDTSDLMTWFNPAMKCCDFISFVVAHSCISESDFGMFWVNKNGEGNFNGMKNILENGIPYFFKNEKDQTEFSSKHLIFSDVYTKDESTLSPEELEKKYSNSCWILFYGDQRNNDSWEAQIFGNSVEVNLYDTFFYASEYKGSDYSWYPPYSQTHTITYKPIQSGTDANDPANRDVPHSRIPKGYVNMNLSNFWDLMPEQNKLMKAEFFANRHTITLNTGKQLDCFAKQDLRIGDPIEIDFTRQFDKSPSIDNGKYIIHTIDWYFSKDTDLEIQLRVASDVIHPVNQV
jgi:hypothetical protein